MKKQGKKQLPFALPASLITFKYRPRALITRSQGLVAHLIYLQEQTDGGSPPVSGPVRSREGTL